MKAPAPPPGLYWHPQQGDVDAGAGFTDGDDLGNGGTSTVRGGGAQLQPGRRIGHYKILEQIDGFTVVYPAEPRVDAE